MRNLYPRTFGLAALFACLDLFVTLNFWNACAKIAVFLFA